MIFYFSYVYSSNNMSKMINKKKKMRVFNYYPMDDNRFSPNQSL